MKKVFLLLILIIAVGTFPYYAPKSTKVYLFELLCKNHPGKFSIEDIHLNYFSGQVIKGFSWEDNHSKLYLPSLTVNASIISILLNGKLPTDFQQGTLLYKNKKLFTNITASLPLLSKGSHLMSSSPCYVKGDIELEGTNAYTNHVLIPPFSAKEVLLTVDTLNWNTEKIKSLKMKGSLSLNRLSCCKNHLLSVILCLLRQPIDREVSVECGKIEFATDDGILLYKKTPFLLDECFEIVSKGTVNMVADQLNLSIGLTTDSLINAFGLCSLPEGYMIPFKINGSIHNPNIDTKPALASIAALLLLKKIDPNSRTYPKTNLNAF
jgi:hypothetical protein